MTAAWAPKNPLMRPAVPQSAGDLTPAGGGRCLPIVLKTWPMKPSGVQFARPILPPGLHDADQLGGGAVLIGREHDAEGRDDDVEAGIGKGQGLGIGLAEFDIEPFGRGPLAPALEQRRHIVGRDDLAPAPRRGQRDIAVARSHIQDALTGTQIEGLAQLFADDLQGGADNRIIAG